jgi:hypothetical protein
MEVLRSAARPLRMSTSAARPHQAAASDSDRPRAWRLLQRSIIVPLEQLQMESIVQSALVPFVKLTQANFAALTEFWLSPDVMWPPFAGPQRAFDPGAASGPATSEALSRLLKGLLENYSHFFVEVSQGGAALWGRSVEAATRLAASPAG